MAESNGISAPIDCEDSDDEGEAWNSSSRYVKSYRSRLESSETNIYLKSTVNYKIVYRKGNVLKDYIDANYTLDLQ